MSPRPSLDPEFARKEDGAGGLAAPKIEYAHPGAQRKAPRQALNLTKSVLAERVFAHPLGVVFRRERERASQDRGSIHESSPCVGHTAMPDELSRMSDNRRAVARHCRG
jgi:hypothetical protein